MADHRFQASDECATCHGEIEFGTDDSSFCANSACHRRAWPEVELDAGFVHPIELVGQHAEVWCHDCHEGERMPEYVCANCHEPPEPHFGPVCEDCHTPTGFDQATLPPEMHPVELVGAHLDADCQGCHGGDRILDPFVCSNCHEPPADHLPGECDVCHSPEGFAESASFLVNMAPEIPFFIAAGRGFRRNSQSVGNLTPTSCSYSAPRRTGRKGPRRLAAPRGTPLVSRPGADRASWWPVLSAQIPGSATPAPSKISTRRTVRS